MVKYKTAVGIALTAVFNSRYLRRIIFEKNFIFQYLSIDTGRSENYLLLRQPKRIMYRVHRPQRIFLRNQHGDADLGSGDHVNIDILVIQTFE